MVNIMQTQNVPPLVNQQVYQQQGIQDMNNQQIQQVPPVAQQVPQQVQQIPQTQVPQQYYQQNQANQALSALSNLVDTPVANSLNYPKLAGTVLASYVALECLNHMVLGAYVVPYLTTTLGVTAGVASAVLWGGVALGALGLSYLAYRFFFKPKVQVPAPNAQYAPVPQYLPVQQ